MTVPLERIAAALEVLASAATSPATQTPLTYSIEAAAARLGGPFTVDWLKGHLSEIPHLKTGNGAGRSGRIGFGEAQLAVIVNMFTIEPVPGLRSGDLTPVTRRRR